MELGESCHSQQISVLCPYATCFILILKNNISKTPEACERVPVCIKVDNVRPVLKSKIFGGEGHE